jgi:hypothetical protein
VGDGVKRQLASRWLHLLNHEAEGVGNLSAVIGVTPDWHKLHCRCQRLEILAREYAKTALAEIGL